jgi:glutaredoxin
MSCGPRPCLRGDNRTICGTTLFQDMNGYARAAARLLGTLARYGRLATALLLLSGVPVAAQSPAGPPERVPDGTVTIHVFRADGCPHCEKALEFLKRYENEPRVSVRDYEVGSNPRNLERFERVLRGLGAADVAVPLVVVGQWWVIGFRDAETTGDQISRQVASCLAAGCPDLVASILAGPPSDARPPGPAGGVELPETVDLPLVGRLRVADLSLPALTVVLAALDGFNPCAMWALVFLLGLLLGTTDRRRTWILGLAFLAGSALVYFLIMAAWLNVLMAAGLAAWVRIAVGLVALAGAAYHLHDYATNPEAVCEVSHVGRRQEILQRLKRFALQERLWPSVLGVVALAIAVNLIELLCSAGIPAVYTQTLALTPMPRGVYYGYLVLYVLVFLLDDIAIFAVAITTLRMTGFGAKYARASRLLGGLLLAAIGLMLLFRPQWLSF